MRRLISKFLNHYTFSSSSILYDKIQELEQKIEFLEEENIETTNVLYELMNDIRGLDSRIDILTSEKFQ
jgi:hypothetical protein